LCAPLLWVARCGRRGVGRVACKSADGWVETDVALGSITAEKLVIPGLVVAAKALVTERDGREWFGRPEQLVADYLNVTLGDAPEVDR